MQVIAGIGDDQNGQVPGLPLAGRGQSFDHLAELDGGDRDDVGPGLQAHARLTARSKRCGLFPARPPSSTASPGPSRGRPCRGRRCGRRTGPDWWRYPGAARG